MGCQFQTLRNKISFFLSVVSLTFFFCIRNKINLITVDSLQNTKKTVNVTKNVTKCHQIRVLKSVSVVPSASRRCFFPVIGDWHFRPE